jgi:hypothetical protein
VTKTGRKLRLSLKGRSVSVWPSSSAIRVALVPRFADGALLVEPAAVASAEAMEEAVASALGVRQRPGAVRRAKAMARLLINDHRG